MDDVTRPKPTVPTPPTSSAPTPIKVSEGPDAAGAPLMPSSPESIITKGPVPVPTPQPPVLPSVPARPMASAPLQPSDPAEKSIPDAPIGSSVPVTPAPVSTPINPTALAEPATTGPRLDSPVPSAPTFVDPTPLHLDDAKRDGKVSQAPTVSAPKKRGDWAIILVAVLLALGLVGGAAYAYLQNKKETNNTSATTQSSTSQTPAKNPATASDVQKASSDIDAALKKLDDNKDYQESSLSDTTLGL